MADPSTSDLEAGLAAVTRVLLEVAGGRFDARAPRTMRGDPVDVLAFLVNATAEEVAALVGQLRAERDELHRTQTKLVHAAKLAALGELAGGVAHELNQPLTAIRGILDLASMQSEAPGLADLELIRRATDRMARIVDSVRTFGRHSPLQIVAAPAASPIEAALELYRVELARAGVTISVEVEPGIPTVMADVDRLQQVFVNLLANAKDAVAGVPAGEARVGLGARADGGWIDYFVEDNGSGVKDEHAAHLFDPFFTTKEVGQGTGLGLSVSYGIVRDHGGEISCERPPGGGARFVLRIPAAPREGDR